MLTSLAGQEDIERGRAAGATAYCIKLDRDQLLAAIRELLERDRPAGSAALDACPVETQASDLRQLSRHICADGPAVPTTIGEVHEYSV
jgi:DNA-binding response OmpR family regulator